MRCEFCRKREAVDRRFRVSYGFAAICEPCRRESIPTNKYKPSAGDFCCVTILNKTQHQQETAGIGEDDARPQKECSHDKF